MIISESLGVMLDFLECKGQLSIADIATMCKVSKQSIYRARRGDSVSARVKMRIMLIYLTAAH